MEKVKVYIFSSVIASQRSYNRKGEGTMVPQECDDWPFLKQKQAGNRGSVGVVVRWLYLFFVR